MKKLSINNYQYPIFIVLLLIILNSSFLIQPIFAAEATASSSSASLPQSLVDKINELKKEIASKAANLKNEVDKKLANKIAAGTVIQVDTVTGKILIQVKNDTKTVSTNEYTTFQNEVKKTTKPSIKDLAKDDFIVALGDLDDKGVLNSKKVIKTTRPKVSPQIISGFVQSLNSPNFNLQTKDGQKITAETTPNTDIFLGESEATFVDIKVKQFLISVGQKPTDKTQDSDFIYISTSGNNIKPEKQIATTSADKVSPSPISKK